jgi:hypothetical protein
MDDQFRQRVREIATQLAVDEKQKLQAAGTLLDLERLTVEIGDELTRPITSSVLDSRAREAAEQPRHACPVCREECPGEELEPIFLKGGAGRNRVLRTQVLLLLHAGDPAPEFPEWLAGAQVVADLAKIAPGPIGDHRPSIRAGHMTFGFDNDRPLSVPAFRLIRGCHEQPLLLFGLFVLIHSLLEQILAFRFEPGIHADAECVPHVHPLADLVHRRDCEPAVGPDFDVDIRPAPADLLNDKLQILIGSQ